MLLGGCWNGAPSEYVRDLVLRGNDLWVCRSLQVDHVDLANNSVAGFPIPCNQLLVARNGWVWAAANHQITVYDGDGWRELDVPHNAAINYLSETSDGAIWVSSDLLSRRDPQTGHWDVVIPALPIPSTTPEPLVNCSPCVRPTSGYIGPVFEAADGAIWFNEQTQGIVRWSSDSKQLWTREDGLSSPSATIFLQSRDGSIWIGTAAGVNRIHDGTLQSWDFPVKADTEGSASWVLDMIEDVQGKVWVAFRRSGLMVWDGSQWSEIGDFGADEPRSIFEASSGEIWICCHKGGILKYVSGSLISYPVNLVTFLELPDHRLLGGGKEGLFLYNKDSDQWQSYPDK